jgi:hypothetical protein
MATTATTVIVATAATIAALRQRGDSSQAAARDAIVCMNGVRRIGAA